MKKEETEFKRGDIVKNIEDPDYPEGGNVAYVVKSKDGDDIYVDYDRTMRPFKTDKKHLIKLNNWEEFHEK